MTTVERRFLLRLWAYIIANVAFYLIQQQFGWLVAFAVAGFAGSARLLARLDVEKSLEGRDGLPK